jgi:hypothetical protein
MDMFDMVWSRGFEPGEEDAPLVAVLRYCHHCQRPIEGHQFMFAPNKFLCKKCWNFRYVLLAEEDRVRPGPGDRISEEPMRFG